MSHPGSRTDISKIIQSPDQLFTGRLRQFAVMFIVSEVFDFIDRFVTRLIKIVFRDFVPGAMGEG
jgi:hypothetical protein